MVKTIDFNKISPLHVQVANQLSMCESRYNGQIGNILYSAEVLMFMGKSIPEQVIVYLDLDIEGNKISMGLDENLFEQLLAGKLDMQVAQSLPKELLMAVMKMSMDRLISEFSKGMGLLINLDDVRIQKRLLHDMIIKCNFSEGSGCGYLDSSAVILDILKKFPIKKKEFRFSDVPYSIGLTVGRSIISMSLLKTFKKGDVIFIQEIVSANEVLARVSGEIVFLGKIYDNYLTIKQRTTPMTDQDLPEVPEEFDEEGQAQKNSQNNSGGDSEVNLSNMKVELLFEVGKHMMTISELQQLRPGYTFELNRPLDQPVTIVANGKVIAVCELVSVENRIGARVIDIKE